ncbi:unnamed protein product [Chrysoparadoxa australica]
MWGYLSWALLLGLVWQVSPQANAQGNSLLEDEVRQLLDDEEGVEAPDLPLPGYTFNGNYIRNAGFEARDGYGWWSAGLDFAVQQDKTGSLSGKQYISLSNPRDNSSYFQQTIKGEFEPNVPYHVKGFIWLDEDSICGRSQDTGACPVITIQTYDTGIGSATMVTANPGAWNTITGVFNLRPDQAANGVGLRIWNMHDQETRLDDISVTRCSVEDVRELTDPMISVERKRSFRVNIGRSDGGELQVNQLKHHFPFGSVANHFHLGSERFRQMFKENFNYSVDEFSQKWDKMNPDSPWETINGPINRVLDFMNENDIPVRGHTLFWGQNHAIQDWLKELPRDGSEESLQWHIWRRLREFNREFDARISTVDVNNEMLHGDWFLRALPCDGNGSPCMCDYKPACPPEITTNMKIDTRSWMFAAMKALTNQRLFMNDYCMVHWCGPTAGISAYLKMAAKINEASGNAVGGYGFQTHVQGGNRVCAMDLMTKFDAIAKDQEFDRYDKQIWLTEIDVQDPDPWARANGLEQIFRAAFASAHVKGTMIWGFWDRNFWRPDCHLVESDFSLNAAGQRIMGKEGLLHKAWKSSSRKMLDINQEESISIHGFHGGYEARYKEKCKAEFSVPEGSGSLQFDIRRWACADGIRQPDPPAGVGHSSLGCYKEGQLSNEDGAVVITMPDLTGPPECAARCLDEKKRGFAVKDGNTCVCTDNLEGWTLASANFCTVPCAGNGFQFCGGTGGFVSLYQVAVQVYM